MLPFLNGCLSRPSLVAQSFTFQTPPARAAATNTQTGPVLAIRRLTVAAPFASPSFVYRTGASAYEQDPYAQFLVPPAESLAEPVRAYLRNRGRFSTVNEAGSALPPTIQAEIFVSELYGDFRNRAAPAAVLGMRCVFLSPSRGPSAGVLAERTFSRRVPLTARTAAAVMAGWNEALQSIMAEVAALPLSNAARW